MSYNIWHINSINMKVLGIFDNKLCILREGARVILELDIETSDLEDILYYEELPVFRTWEEMESFAYGL